MMFLMWLACAADGDDSFSYGPSSSKNASSPSAEPSSEPSDVNSDSDDRDGDGYSNVEEEEAGTNPDFASSHPYEQGNYNIGLCETGLPDDLGPTDSVSVMINGTTTTWATYQTGDGVENLILKDQFGQEVELHSFCGRHVMLVVSSFT